MNKKITILGTGLAAGILCMAMAFNTFAAQITEDRAKTIAMEDAGVTQEQISFVKVKRDYDDGRSLYEVEFFTNDYKEYDYEIDQQTGTILSKDFDAEYAYWERNREAGTAAQTVQGRAKAQVSQEGIDKAKAAALETAGLSDSQVTWGRVKADYDDGRLLYEGKFFYNNMEYEFEVDAELGIVMEWDAESIYD